MTDPLSAHRLRLHQCWQVVSRNIVNMVATYSGKINFWYVQRNEPSTRIIAHQPQ